jgi:serine/threonine protein kinase
MKKTARVDEDQEQKLKKVFRLNKALSHPCLIEQKEYFFDSEKKTTVMVMEHCQNVDLKLLQAERLQKKQPFSDQEVLSIATQLASLLRYLHKEGVCHRDLKPDNIIYSPETGSLKLIDFDICSVRDSNSCKFDMWSNTGTMAYRAPEMFRIGYD